MWVPIVPGRRVLHRVGTRAIWGKHVTPQPPLSGGRRSLREPFSWLSIKNSLHNTPERRHIALIAQATGLGLGGSRDFTLPIAAESPAAAGDFELITRLVIMDSGEAGR